MGKKNQGKPHRKQWHHCQPIGNCTFPAARQGIVPRCCKSFLKNRDNSQPKLAAATSQFLPHSQLPPGKEERKTFQGIVKLFSSTQFFRIAQLRTNKKKKGKKQNCINKFIQVSSPKKLLINDSQRKIIFCVVSRTGHTSAISGVCKNAFTVIN